MDKRDNKILIEIVAKVFGGKFASFFKKNLNDEFSSNYNFANMLYHLTNFENSSKDSLIKNARDVFYIMFYDSLMDYIFYKVFGVENAIKKNIPIIRRNAVSTGVSQYDNLIKLLFEEIVYSKNFTSNFQNEIEVNILNNFYNNLRDDEELRSVLTSMLNRNRPKSNLGEGIWDKIFGSESHKRLKIIMENTLELIPKSFRARNKIINALKNGEINNFLTSVENYKIFVAKEYADPLNKVAMPIILIDFYQQMADRFQGESDEVKEFFEIVIINLFKDATFQSKMRKLSYSFFRQYAEFVHTKKVEKRKVGRPKTDPTKFNFKRK